MNFSSSSRTTKTPWPPGVVISVLALVVSVSLLELLAMGYYRFYIKELKKPVQFYLIRQAPEPLLYEHLPGGRVRDADVEVRINSLGLRGSEDDSKKDANTVRVLGIGDSVTFGLGVPSEATFLKVLEQLLQRRQDRTFQVMNGAVVGYNTFQEFISLRDKGVSLNPDAVILGFVLNDWRGRSNINAGGFFSKRLYSNTFDGVTGIAEHLLMILERRSFLFSAVVSRMEDLTHRLWPQTIFTKETYRVLLDQNFRKNPVVAPGWNEARASLLNIAALTKSRGIRLLVVVLPGRWQVYGPTAGLAAPQADIVELCRANGIEVIDPLPRFLENRHFDLFRKESALHLSPAGHKVVAEELLKVIGGWSWDPR